MTTTSALPAPLCSRGIMLNLYSREVNRNRPRAESGKAAKRQMERTRPRGSSGPWIERNFETPSLKKYTPVFAERFELRAHVASFSYINYPPRLHTALRVAAQPWTNIYSLLARAYLVILLFI
jgi:hypothetical protein